MKGKTQLPQLPPEELLVLLIGSVLVVPAVVPHELQDDVESVVVYTMVVGVVVDPSEQYPDSSPRAAKENLLVMITAALLDTFWLPVSVPVTG